MPVIDHQALAVVPDDVRAAIDDVHEQSWAMVDPALLDLARLRMAMLLGAESELGRRTPAAVEAGLDEAKVADLAAWPTSERFSDLERAALGVAEQFVIDVANVTPSQIDALAAHLEPAEVYGFVNALLALDGYQRLLLTLDGLSRQEAR